MLLTFLLDGKVKILMVKGAPDVLLPVCFGASLSTDPSSLRLKYWATAVEERAALGMRTLALSFAVVPPDFRLDATQQHQSLCALVAPSQGLHLLSLLGIMDPPRPEAILAVKQAHTAGIVVKMITGDHPTTALSISKMLGICNSVNQENVLTGRELDGLAQQSLDALDAAVQNVNVFARVTPEHKLMIVQSLRRQRIVCSMTGDGVNDAPALKAADIGVAMGITGTEVAKNAANMIITDDNFSSIVDAIRIGRCTYDNLVKIITFILSVNGGQAFSIILAISIGIDLPFTALQILWINMLVSVALGIELAFDEPESDILTRPPRPVSKPLFGELVAWRIFAATVAFVAAVLGMYIWESQRRSSVKYLQTCAVNVLVMSQAAYIFNCRHLKKNLPLREFLCGNRLVYVGVGVVILFQALYTYAEPFQYLFGSVGLDVTSWLKIVGFAIAVQVGVELEKLLVTYFKARLLSSEFAEADGIDVVVAV